MLVSTRTLLNHAEAENYAIGAFNIYNLEGVKAVISAAEAIHSPVILQLHPSALKYGSQPLIALCLTAAQESIIPVSVHLDHSASADQIQSALKYGVRSIMADGSHLSFTENVAFTCQMTHLVHQHEGTVEAELGRLAGTEDGLTIAEYQAKLTDPEQAAEFIAQTGSDALAVCIGNVHGVYHSEPDLDFDRLIAIRQAVSIPLVLHGASGLPAHMIQQAIDRGIRKFNVNTELRAAYVGALRSPRADNNPDLLDLLQGAVDAMQMVVIDKLRLFRSENRS